MNRVFFRKILASTALTAITLTSLAFLPAGIHAQEAVKQEDKKAKGSQAKEGDAKPSATPVGPSPLAEKDDPSKIGKRKINNGSDKLFGWLGGSREKEIALGRQLSLEVEKQTKLVEDPMVTEYVNRVGQNIVLHSDAKLPFTIKVIDSDEVNAFALPGGFFYVHRGLVLAAENEAELAGVMAHEIAHVTARHAMENQGKSTAINYGALIGIIFGGPIVSGVLQNGGGILAGLAGMKFSRNAEIEADRLGVQYLYAAGYDPQAMSTMFEKLASQNKKKPGTLLKLFSTHPQSVERRDGSLALVARFPEREEYVMSTSEFERVKGHLGRLTNAKAGISVDFDEAGDQKPTLKRRQPESTDGPEVEGTSSSEAPPKLKRRDEPTTPQPTPTPQN